MRACTRALADDGSLWVLTPDEWADEVGCRLRRAGLHRRAWIKWHERSGAHTPDNFRRCSRHLFYMVKDPRRFIFHPDAVTRPADRLATYEGRRADPGDQTWDDVWTIPRLTGTCDEQLPDFPTTQIPLALLLPIVGCASEPDDLVLDPFNGSGTTGVAALQLGRRYRGIEQTPEFARLSRLRLTAARDPEVREAG